jgi:4-amino-4-deoxychorismate lyase
MSLFFETIKVENQTIYNIKYHNKRLNATIEQNFGIKSNIDLNSFITPPTTYELYRCKIIYDKEIKSVHFYPYIPKNIQSFKIIRSKIKYDYKYADRSSIETLFLQRELADDILIINKDGYIKDTSVANIALKMDGIWYTPKKPLLKGTMREKFLEKNLLKLSDLKVEDIEKIESFAIINAMIGFKVIRNPKFII